MCIDYVTYIQFDSREIPYSIKYRKTITFLNPKIHNKLKHNP